MMTVDEPRLDQTDSSPMVSAKAVLPLAPKDAKRSLGRPPFKPIAKKVAQKVAVAALVLVVLYYFHDRVITTLMFNQRQEHLTAEMAVGTPTIESGEAVAILQAVDIDLNVTVIEDVTVDHLRSAPARVSASAVPGDEGVTVIFGHRTAYGGPFENIDELANGQSIVVQTRSGGPITRYIVDRVERSASLGAIELENDLGLAYLLLVTNESEWTSNEQTVVVARALPVTDNAAVIPQLGGVTATGLPYGVDTLLAALAGVAAALSWSFLRSRTSTAVRLGIVIPSAAFAAIGIMMTLDGLLPLAR